MSTNERITQDQFDAIVFYMLQAYRYAREAYDKNSSGGKDAGAARFFIAMATNRLRALAPKTEYEEIIKVIQCSDVCILLCGESEDAAQYLYNVESENKFKNDLETNLNTHFSTNYLYNESANPSLFAHFLDVYALALFMGVTLTVAGAALIVLMHVVAIPVLLNLLAALVGGFLLGFGVASTMHKVVEFSALYFFTPDLIKGDSKTKVASDVASDGTGNQKPASNESAQEEEPGNLWPKYKLGRID